MKGPSEAAESAKEQVRRTGQQKAGVLGHLSYSPLATPSAPILLDDMDRESYWLWLTLVGGTGRG